MLLFVNSCCLLCFCVSSWCFCNVTCSYCSPDAEGIIYAIQGEKKSSYFCKQPSAEATLPVIIDFSSLKWQRYPSLCRRCCSASLTSWLHLNVTGRISLTKTSEVGQRNSEFEKNETLAADLRASTGSLHIIKARGCFQWLRLCPSPHRLHQAPTRWFISAVVLNVFSRLERWELMRFTHVCQEIHFGGKRTCNSSKGKERLSLPSYVSSHTAPPIHGRTAG